MNQATEHNMNGELIGLREAKSNYGYLAQDDQIIHFGTSGHKRVDIKVKFITGKVTELKNVKTNSIITVE